MYMLKTIQYNIFTNNMSILKTLIESKQIENDDRIPIIINNDTKSQKINVGDYIAFGISHPCTTFDKWRLLYLVDKIYNVIGGVRTYLS